MVTQRSLISAGFVLDIVTGLWLDIHMNRNSNTISTAILHDGDTAATISTAAARLLPGDVVFGEAGDLTVDTLFNDPGFGTWVYWTNGGRDSYPAGFRVYRVVEA